MRASAIWGGGLIAQGIPHQNGEDELDEELKKQGAKSVQIKNIKNAISENVKANNAGMEWLCAENPTFMC